MKLKKLLGYKPDYPAKKTASKLGALAAAAAMAVGGIVGCRPDKPALGGAPMVTEPADVTPAVDTEEPVPMGDVMVDPTEIDVDPALMGEPPIYDTEVPGEPQTTGLFYFPDPTESSPCVGTETPDDSLEPELMGDVAIPPEELP